MAVDRRENEGRALNEGRVNSRGMSLPAFFGRAPEIANRRARARKLSSQWPIVWIARMVGLGLLLLVLMNIFGFGA